MPELNLLSPKGFRAGAVYAGIKSRRVPDVAMLVCDTSATAAAVFTTNKVVSPGVIVGRGHIAKGKLRGVVVNAGNANACTGKQGQRDALRMCSIAASRIGCDPTDILPSSTGIIGHLLPMDKIRNGILGAADDLGSSAAHATRFADAICTTDTRRKVAGARFKIGRDTVTIAGVCKGAGMIGPRLALHAPHATMLAYLTTDAKIAAPLLRTLLASAADRSFNAVTIDDHASTNDTCAILASGMSNVAIKSPAEIRAFAAVLDEVSQSLAYKIAEDGEGATKVVKIAVNGAKSDHDAATIARTIANSPLVKCAMHGNDPNWGRIVSAAGYADAAVVEARLTLLIQKTPVYRDGRPVRFDAAKVSKSLDSKEVLVELHCGLGKGHAIVWTCDLSRDYITINADYHT